MQINESEFDENYLKLANNGLVVTQLSELPADPFGFSEAFKLIDFSKYTLLLQYVIHDWKNRDLFTRCAILVNKLPENANVKCLMSLGAITRGWD